MTTEVELNHRVTFQRRGPDANGDPLGPWVDIETRWAAIVALKGGEDIRRQRLEGNQPVIIIVRRDPVTRTVDNSWRAADALPEAGRGDVGPWDITSVIWNQADDMMEIMAVERRGGSDA